MNVGDVQDFLRNVGTLLAAHQGKKPAGDFDAFCAALEPFQSLAIGTFAQFLQVAAEYQRSGVLPTGPAKNPRKPATPRAASALKRKDDVVAIDEAVARLQQLFDHATDAGVTHETIEAEVARIEQTFDAEGLKAVARRFGISSGLSSKSAAKTKILDRIAERKGRHERGEVIGEVARAAEPAKSETPASDKRS